MNRQRLRRTPVAKASGTLMDTEMTISFVIKKNKTDHMSTPSSSPITKPLLEKTWGGEVDGSQVRYGQRPMRAVHVTPIANADCTALGGLSNKMVRKKMSPSANPLALLFKETIGGLYWDLGKSTKTTVKTPINPPITRICNTRARLKGLCERRLRTVATKPRIRALTSPQVMTNVNHCKGPCWRPSRS